MKKLYFMAVAAIAALSSCTSDNDLELNQNTGKEALTFTATMEDSEATRATYDNTNQYALWEAGDQISINGKSYTAQEGAGATATFKATTEGDEAEGPTYNAYFPADLFDGTTATLPAIQTYEAGKFNMPMYAESTTTTLAFKNLCAVLAIKVTNADITTLKSIKVASDKKMNGTFTVTDNKAVIGTDGTNAVVLESATALTLDADGTTFYIAIPAQTYQYLNIFLSADGETYTQAMATKKAAGLGEIARSKIFNIDYAKNATKLWEGNLFFADCNVGATAENIYGGLYTWGGTQDARVSYTDDHNTGSVNLTGEYDTATNLWGSNWRMPTKEELTTLKGFGSWNSNGLLCESPDYENNTIFLPAAGYYDNDNVRGQNEQGCYWASSLDDYAGFALSFYMQFYLDVDISPIAQGCSVRAVLEEAASPAPAAEYPAGSKGKATATIGGSEVDVNWIQLWENGPKFAEYNVGATSVAEYGGYYCRGGSYNNDPSLSGSVWTTDYINDHVTLSGNTDTATKLWGSNWRMPTNEEIRSIVFGQEENLPCTVTWTDNYNGTGIKGGIITGKGAYSTNSIFLPAAGWLNNGTMTERETLGYYWSSQYDQWVDGWGYIKISSSSKNSMTASSLNRAYSVRAVLNESAE